MDLYKPTHAMKPAQDEQDKEQRAAAAVAALGTGQEGKEVVPAETVGKPAKQRIKSDADMEEERRTKEIVRQFFETTSAHGWGHVARAPNYPVKALWMVMTITAFAINVAHVTILVTQYLQFPYEQVPSTLLSYYLH